MRFPMISGAAALMLVATPAFAGAQTARHSSGHFERRVIATGLKDPYEVTTAADGSLWMTEKTGGRVLRMDPANGHTRTALTLSNVATPDPEDGLLGLALQQSHGKVKAAFISYTYRSGNGMALRIVKYTTAKNGVTLTHPRVLLDHLPATMDHQGGKLRLGPDGMLYYTIGDQGADHATYPCVPNKAQRLPSKAEVRAHNWVAYQGKTLRMTTSGAIPRDNPVLRGVRSHVFAYGQRNAQGLDFGLNGRLYTTDHGQKTDDEVNRMVRGGNYGWPYVAGWRDNRAYQYANWSKSSPTACNKLTFNDTFVPSSVPQMKETSWRGAMQNPMTTAGSTVGNGYNFRDPACPVRYTLCHPTFAPSSLTAYNQSAIPGWKGSLLVTSLKRGQVYRMSTNAAGTKVTGIQKLFTAPDRYRDTAISRDGKTIYVAADRKGMVKLNGRPSTDKLQDRGAIIAYTYVNR